MNQIETAKPHEVASVSLDAFNAFGPMPPVIESESPNVWTAFPVHVKALRTYLDCFQHESDFVLVIGSEQAALMELESTDKPVAHEDHLATLEHGSYRVHEHNGGKVIESLAKDALHVSSVRVRRQR